MAEIYTGYRNYSRFYLSWTLAEQDVPNNRSLVNWTVGIQGQPGYTAYWYSNAVRINSAYVDNQGNLASGTWSGITLANGASVPLRSGSVWIYHNSDGNKSFGASLSGWLYGYGDLTTSGSWSLPTIPRNSQVTTDKSSYTLGEAIRVNTNRKSTSFTHSITLRHNNGSGTVLKTFNSVGDYATWTPTAGEITTMQGLIPNSNQFTLHISQWNNQVGQGSTATRTLNLTDANPTFTDFTFKDSNASVVTITGNNQVLVAGKSTLETTISTANKMVAIKGSTASKYSVAYDGVTSQKNYSASAAIVDTFNPTTTGDRTILATAFDSRGNNTSVSKLVTVYDYSAPTIETTLTRENNFGSNTTIKLSGKYTPLVIGGVAKNSLTIGSLQYRYKENGGTFGSWTAKTFTASNGSYSITDFVVSLDSTKKYDFEFKISDKFGTVTTTGIVDIGQPIVYIGENSGAPALGVGKMPTNGALDVEGDIYSNGEKVKVGGGFKVGIINNTTLATTGIKTISGFDFKPQLVRFKILAGSSVAAAYESSGAMDSSGSMYTSASSTQGTNSARRSMTDRALIVVGPTGTITLQIQYSSMGYGEFSINVVSASSDFSVAYEAYG